MIARHSRKVWLGLIFLGVVNYVVYRQQTHAYTYDETQQIAAAMSLLSGKGLVRIYAQTEHLVGERSLPLFEWPQGYSLLFAGAYKLTNDVWLATQLLDAIAALLFFTGFFGLIPIFLKHASPGLHWGIGLIASLIFVPLAIGQSSDVLCIGIFVIALLNCCREIEDQNSTGWRLGLVSGLLMAACATIRYAYLPLLAILPLSFLVLSLQEPKKYRRALSLHLLVIALIVAVGFWEQKARTSEYIGMFKMHALTKNQPGFYWKQLKWFTPFPAFFLSVQRLFGVLATFHIRLARSTRTTLEWIPTGVVLFWGGVGWFYAFRARGGALTRFALSVALFTVIFTVGSLSYMSVRYQQTYIATWVHVSEPRYFLPMIPFLLIFCTWGLVKAGRVLRIARPLSVGLLGVLAVCALLGRARECWNALSRPEVYATWPSLSKSDDAQSLWRVFRSYVDAKKPPVLYLDAKQQRLQIALMAGVPAIHPAHLVAALPHRKGPIEVLVHPSCDAATLDRLRSEPHTVTRVAVSERLELLNFSIDGLDGAKSGSVL